MIPKQLLQASMVVDRRSRGTVVEKELGKLPDYGIQITNQLLRVIADRTGLSEVTARSMLPRGKATREYARVDLPERTRKDSSSDTVAHLRNGNQTTPANEFLQERMK
jgi:hypothetical protein